MFILKFSPSSIQNLKSRWVTSLHLCLIQGPKVVKGQVRAELLQNDMQNVSPLAVHSVPSSEMVSGLLN